MQSRRIARELALLSLPQLPSSPEKLSSQQLNDIIIGAIRTLTAEVRDALEESAAELQRASDRLLNSQIRATDVRSSRAMVQEALELTSQAINRVGIAVELPEFIQLSNQKEVHDYALEIISNVGSRKEDIDEILTSAMVDWQLSRLAKIDRDILRIAVCEMCFLEVPDRVAANEAVELAKRYSEDEGHRFINGVLRRVIDQIGTPVAKGSR